ncbi:MAG: hypothetical protein NTY93_00655 [Candidatus Kaiserbacteria bacterium]|nr:hypothetical protein [Candidatus Kaiserbacteria bacterium]
MKKILLASICFLFLGLVPHVFAATTQGFIALAPIPGLTDTANTSVVNSASLANFFNNLYKYLIGLAAILAVIEIIWGGFRIATNQDNVSILMENKGKIYNAILGLVLVLSPVLVFSIINPSILNLSLNLPALDTYSAPATTGSSASVQSNVDGCIATTGPAAGTILATCIVSDSSGAKSASELKSAAESKTVDFIHTNCAESSNFKSGLISNSCPKDTVPPNQGTSGGSIIYICTKATAIVWCSPTVTVNSVQNIQTTVGVGVMFIDLGYFGENNTFPASCGGDWFLIRAGDTATKQDRGTSTSCDSNVINNLISTRKIKNPYECVSVPVYCKHK